ncbi:hypothetical protein FC83_GL002754 [Agrilactobacillus composti DSM 18527 = JCM 14202]|uniref:Uncharacterized protein n=1 Tax=Agrilactobacillus composti DSM 18527 = JCM 14202 TaxID=1423734 RepID=X0PHJ0_9LACO|nr:hypothetical protein FC83_GL002754 [Agrilactobacillus composti DSM 18527 = JCM 14202]GAF41599.1 hypothetical protein JCM14202_3551 [Agrilactobacillus composti DSM 18527 = JCM 14202]
MSGSDVVWGCNVSFKFLGGNGHGLFGAEGEIWYSKSRKATKIDNVIDDYPHIYYQYLYAELMKMVEQANFPLQTTIAWH